MNDDVHIRRLTVEDIPAAVEIKRAGAKRAYQTLCDQNTLDLWLDHNASATHYAHRVNRSDYVVLVAEKAGEIVGVASFRIWHHRADMGGLYVKTSGRGIGRALSDERVKIALNLGLTRARVLVWDGNARAESFIARQGFLRIKKSIRDKITGARILYYERDLEVEATRLAS